MTSDKPLQVIDKTVVCRICEEQISAALLKEHSKFCVIANTWDMIAMANDSSLVEVTKKINDMLQDAMKDQSNDSPGERKTVDIQLLQNLKKIARSAYDSDIVECIKLLVKLREHKKLDSNDDIAKEMELLVRQVQSRHTILSYI